MKTAKELAVDLRLELGEGLRYDLHMINGKSQIENFIEQIQQDARKELEWLYSHCKIVCWPKDGSYPIEHNSAVHKDSRELLLAEFKKQL